MMEMWSDRVFSWHPWIPGTLKLDSILSLFKCALPNQNGLQNALSLNGETNPVSGSDPLRQMGVSVR